jgi:F-type H+-transporting ATPase subunit epsilon
MATLHVEIVSPEAALWTGAASALIARSSEGDFTVLPEHTETVGDIVSSVVRVQSADEGEIAFGRARDQRRRRSRPQRRLG